MDWGILGRWVSRQWEMMRSRRNLLRTRTFWLILVVFVFAAVSVAGYAWAKKKVTLLVDGKEVQVQTFKHTVGDLLKDQGIAVGAADQVEPGLSAPLKDDMRVAVNHAIHVNLLVDGETKEIQTCQHTVANVLQEGGIALNPQDITEPGLHDEVSDGAKIEVIRVNTEEETKEISIESPVRRESDPNLAKGFTKVLQAGQNGLEKQRWQVVYHNGQEVSRQLLERVVARKPAERVLAVGVAQQVSRGGRDINFKQAIDMVATAYSHTGNNTASGVYPSVGVVAVDPRVIPLGSRLYVEGYGYAKALDRGGAIKGNRIDVFLESNAEARRWGVRRVTVYVLD